MENPTTFNKSIVSPNGIKSLITIFPVGFLGIYLVQQGHHWKGAFFLVASLVSLIHYMRLPKTVFVSDEKFVIDQMTFQWNSLQKVVFKVDGLSDKTNQIIEIFTTDTNRYLIKPRYYNQSKLLRKLFEKIARLRGINVKVEDRGI